MTKMVKMSTNSRISRHKGAILLLSAALLTGTAALAGEGRPGPGRGGHVLRRAMASLDLSEKQKDQVWDILEASRPAMQALREEMRGHRRALREAADAPNPDRAAVGDAFLRVKADREAIRAKRQAVRAEINAVLTPEQRTRLEGYLEGMRFGRPGRFGRSRG